MDLTVVLGLGDIHSQALGRGVITDSLPSRGLPCPCMFLISFKTMAAPKPSAISVHTRPVCVGDISAVTELFGWTRPTLRDRSCPGKPGCTLRPRCLCLTEGPALDLTPSVEDWFSDVTHLSVPSTRAEWDSENVIFHGSASQEQG